MNKKFFILDEERDIKYHVVLTQTKKGDSKYTLFASDSEAWGKDFRNTELLSLTDNGNGVELSKPLKKLEYFELEYLRILIQVENKVDGGETLKVFEVHDVFEL